LEATEGILSELLSTFSNTDIIEPDKALVLERLAYVLTRQGRTNEAYIYTKLLAEAFPGANEVQEKYRRAVEKFQAKDLDEAQKIILAILEDYPSYKKATQLLGIISYLRGDNELASKYLSESVDPEVANPMTRHIYAATNLKLNDPKKVLEILEASIHNETSAQTQALYGLAAMSDKQYLKGEAALL
jgi:predicted Zn-dependent protease